MASRVVRSSTSPSAKTSCSGSFERLSNGSTAIAGLPPKPGTGFEPPSAEDRPSSRSTMAASVRLLTSRASMMAATCAFTVARAIPSTPAISGLVSPRAISSSTSICRGVSGAWSRARGNRSPSRWARGR
jgi:hypothetical protein